MKKKTLSLLATVLFVLIGSNMALALTLDNNVARFVLCDTTGVVTGAYYNNNGVWSANLLDSTPTNAGLTFGVHYQGATSTAWLHEVMSAYTTETSGGNTYYRYHGTQSVTGTTSLALDWDVMLVDSKNYLDMRVNITAVGGDVDRVKPYFYMELPEGSTLSKPTKTPGGSGWMIVDDYTNNWSGGKSWGASTYKDIFAGQNIGAIVREDKYKAGDASSIWTTANNGWNYTNVPSYSGSDPTWGMKVDNASSAGLYYTINNGQSESFDSRLEVNPEPATMGLMLTGLVGLAGMARRKFFLG